MFAPDRQQNSSPMFVATTCRYVFYTLAMASVGGWAAVLMGIPPINPMINFAVSLGLVIKTLWDSKVKRDQESAFKWLLAFAAWTGLTISSVLTLLAVNVANGPMIIATALLITVAQTGALTYYAFKKAQFSNEHVSIFGSFLSLGLTSLVGLGIFNMIFGVPFTFLTHAVLGYCLFSAYLVYDLYQVKNGGFDTAVEAALNIFLDIVNIFLDLVRILFYLKNNDKKDFENHVWEFTKTRLLPLLIVVGCIASFGLFEKTLASEQDDAKDHAQAPRPGEGPSFWSWITDQSDTLGHGAAANMQPQFG